MKATSEHSATREPGATREPLVAGGAFLGVIKQIKTNHGRGVADRVLQQAKTRGADGHVFAERITVLGWFDYPTFVALLRAADTVVGRGNLDYCRELGIGAAKLDLKSLFSFIARMYGPEKLIWASSRVWPRYYANAGRMEAHSASPDDTRLRIYEFSEMDLAHCRLMEGWMIGAMDHLGATVNDDGRQTAFMGSGDPYHEFACSWRRR